MKFRNFFQLKTINLLYSLNQAAACNDLAGPVPCHSACGQHSQGWQYGAVRSEFEHEAPCTLNRNVLAYRTPVQFLKRTVPVYHYKTGVPYRHS